MASTLIQRKGYNQELSGVEKLTAMPLYPHLPKYMTKENSL